jgi:hypothetical protein
MTTHPDRVPPVYEVEALELLRTAGWSVSVDIDLGKQHIKDNLEKREDYNARTFGKAKP